MKLCGHLHSAGYSLLVTDLDPARTALAVDRFGAMAISPDAIHAADVDIWAPCGLGGVVTAGVLPQIRARAIVGAANNQLAEAGLAADLRARDIVWIPDYLVSAGGVLGVAEEVAAMPGRPLARLAPIAARLRGIGERVTELLQLSQDQGVTPAVAAEARGRALIGR